MSTAEHAPTQSPCNKAMGPSKKRKTRALTATKKRGPLTVTFGACFFFANSDKKETRGCLGSCVDLLQTIYGEHLKWTISTQEPRKHFEPFNAEEGLYNSSPLSEIGRICASNTPNIADDYRINYDTRGAWDPDQGLGTLEIRLPATSDNLDKFKSIFEDTCQTIKPIHAFGGLISALPWNWNKWQPHEYELSTEYFGIIVGSREGLSLSVKNGILSPAWLLALNDEWYARIGGDSALTDLKLPSLQATYYPGGVILQAGDYPDPLPVSEGLPAFWRQYNAWLKPLRTQDLDCFHTASLDPVEQFDTVTTRMWCERMDEGAVWPPDAEAYENKFQAMNAADDPAPPTVLTAHPGEPCPETGDWYAVNLGGKTVFVQKGEPMPGPSLGPTGEVIWHLRKA